MRGLHTLAPPRCRLAAIYLIAACASPGEFYDIGNSRGISYIRTKWASPQGLPNPSLMRGLHALAPPRCRLAAIYLIAACASRPEGFLYNRKVQSIFLLYKKGEPDISSVSPVQWLFCKVFPHLKPHSVLLRHSTEKGWKHIAILLSFAFYPYQTISTTISS